MKKIDSIWTGAMAAVLLGAYSSSICAAPVARATSGAKAKTVSVKMTAVPAKTKPVPAKAATSMPPPLAAFKEGEALLVKHEYRAAIVRFDRALRLHPGFAAALVWRGRCYLALEDTKKALADLSAAIKLNPKIPDAYYYRARTFIEERKMQAAIRDCTSAIALAKRDDFYKLRAGLLLMYDRQKEAVSDYTAALSCSPDDPGSIYFDRGGAYERLGEPRKAIADYTKAIELGTKSAGEIEKAYANRSNLYKQIGRMDLSARDLKLLKERTSDTLGLP